MGINMFKENSFVIDDWHPVGAIADAIEGKTYKTKVLGTSIWYKLTNEGLSAKRGHLHTRICRA